MHVFLEKTRDLLLATSAIKSGEPITDLPAFRARVETVFRDLDALKEHPKQDIEEVKYAIAAFVDEAVLQHHVDEHEPWLANPLQQQFFHEHQAGEGFFDRLEACRDCVDERVDVLAVYYLCLLLGFRGRYWVRDPAVLGGVVKDLGRCVDLGRAREDGVSQHVVIRRNTVVLKRWAWGWIQGGVVLVFIVGCYGGFYVSSYN